MQAALTLSREPGIMGLKDSSGNFHRFRELVALLKGRADFGVAQGDEWTIDASVLIGADAIVPGIGSIAPRLCVDIFNAAKAGQVKKAQTYQEQLLRLFQIYGDNVETWCAGIKEALRFLGLFHQAIPSRPLPQLTEKEKKRIHKVLKEENLI